MKKSIKFVASILITSAFLGDGEEEVYNKIRSYVDPDI